MARRLGIILATTVVALLVMTDGAWACRCMNRLINRCGHRRACCCICVQPTCCQPAAMPACCQPAAGEMKPGEGAVKVEAKVVPAGTNPDVMPPVPEVKSPLSEPKPATPPEMKPEIKPEVKPEIKPEVKPLEVPAEPRVPAKPDIAPAEPVKPVEPAKLPEKPAEPPVVPLKAPEPPKDPAPAVPEPKVPDKAPAPAVPDAKVPDKAPAPAVPDAKTPEKAPKPADKDDPFGAGGSNDVKTLRMWTDASGKYQIEARFVSFLDGSVRLQRADGHYVRIAYDRLCSVDQSFVLNQDQSLLAAE